MSLLFTLWSKVYRFMHRSKLFFSLITLLFSFSVCLIGAYLLIIANTPFLYRGFVQWLGQAQETLIWISLGITVFGAVCLTLLASVFKRRYLLFKIVGKSQLMISEGALATLIQTKLKEKLPKVKLTIEIVIARRNRLEILLDLLGTDAKELERIEEEIDAAIAPFLTHDQEYVLNVHFTEPQEVVFSYFPS